MERARTLPVRRAVGVVRLPVERACSEGHPLNKSHVTVFASDEHLCVLGLNFLFFYFKSFKVTSDHLFYFAVAGRGGPPDRSFYYY